MELLTIEDVAALFRVSKRKTIDNWLYTGVLPRTLTVKVGRHVFFMKDKLEEFIKNTHQKQTASI